MDEQNLGRSIERLLDIMARLRAPNGGCPWDLEQSYATIAPYTIEEAYEVADAIAEGDMAALKDELGDLLFQVVFYAQMAREDGLFDFDDVATSVAQKMIARHPHVFGDATVDTAAAQTEAWEAHKARERDHRPAPAERPPGVLDGVALALPALMRAEKLQRRAARVGFDWPDPAPVAAKIEEELAEFRDAAASGGEPDALEDELGDLIFACVNLARHHGIDPEAALRRTNAKFERRFRAIEAALARDGRAAGDADLDELERLWQAAKLDGG